MQTDEYIKNFLINDIILAFVLVITAYTWYQLLGDENSNEEAPEGDAIAEVVIPAETIAADNES